MKMSMVAAEAPEMTRTVQPQSEHHQHFTVNLNLSLKYSTFYSEVITAPARLTDEAEDVPDVGDADDQRVVEGQDADG